MVVFLSQEWIELHRELGGALPARPGVTARVQHVVTGAPGGDVRYHVSVVDGRYVAAGLGDDPAAEVTLTTTYPDALAVERGELDASAAFMQGRVKTLGSMGTVMALMPLTRSEELAVVRAEIAARTAW